MRRTVVFDFGAVLFRWQPLELLQAVLPQHAPDENAAREWAARIFESFTPDSDWARFDLDLVDEAQLARRIAQRTGLAAEAARQVIDAASEHLTALPATLALFRQLQAAGHRLMYLSNMPRPYANRLERANPFIGDFENGIFSGRVGLMKPWPAIFELASLQFGLSPGQETLFIDDHPGNIAASRKHGWHGLRFEHAKQAEAELRRLGWLQPCPALPTHP